MLVLVIAIAAILGKTKTIRLFLQKQRDLRKEFRAFCDKLEQQRPGEPLETLLMLPLQRVPQYLNSLVNLLGVTATDAQDYEKLKQVGVRVKWCWGEERGSLLTFTFGIKRWWLGRRKRREVIRRGGSKDTNR